MLDDTTDEVDETVTLTLSNATGGATLGTANATVTIVDDDLAPIPPAPPTQTSNVKARYGGAIDGVLLAMLFGLLAVTLYGRRRAQRRSSTTRSRRSNCLRAAPRWRRRRAPMAGISVRAPASPSPRRLQRISNRHWERSGMT